MTYHSVQYYVMFVVCVMIPYIMFILCYIILSYGILSQNVLYCIILSAPRLAARPFNSVVGGSGGSKEAPMEGPWGPRRHQMGPRWPQDGLTLS